MKLNILITLIFSAAISKAQVTISPAVDSSLYVGIDNPVTIRSTTIPLNQLTLKTDVGKVGGSNGQYKIRCSNAAPTALIEVIYKNKVVAEKKLKVNRISDPLVYVVGDSVFPDGESITQKQLLSVKSLIAKTNYPLIKIVVTGFSAEIIRAGKTLGKVYVQKKFTELMLYLKTAIPGDEILFDQVLVSIDGERNRVAPSIKLKVI
jgi:hypothetical protein